MPAIVDRLLIHHLYWRSLRPAVRTWRGGPLVVMPGVLDPIRTKVGAWLAETVAEEVTPGARWLDLGCGTGVVGLALAEAGAEVTCADIDSRAVQNAALNAELRGLRVRCVRSDLLAAFAPDSFDVVAFNIPFWPGPPRGPFGRALHAGEDYALFHRFVETFRPAAREARVVLSERGGDFEAAREALGPNARLVRRTRHRHEWLDLFAL